MNDTSCKHEWTPVNLHSGYIVTEGCSHCGARQSLFTLDDRHHMDAYVRGEHKWRFLGSSQTVKFDLKCVKCGKVVQLRKTVALMLCTECMQDCEAGKKAKHEGGENVWVYLALCPDSSHLSGDCVGAEETEALTDYFNSKIKTPGKKILILPCNQRPSIDLCEGDVIVDVGLKDLY